MMSSEKQKKTERVIVYIDGFNFYFGLRTSEWKCYYWLDYAKLAEKITSRVNAENPTLIATKYFTARISSPYDKRKRQSDYLEALEVLGGINIYFGNYREKQYDCGKCKHPNIFSSEKQTDVNIAVQMLIDAYQDNFDTAILIGGDSDLVPPIKSIREIFPDKKVMACFPPNRSSKEILGVANGQLHIREADLKNNQLPVEIEKPGGYRLKCPKYWK